MAANVDVYLDDFISVIQGGSKEWHQMIRHLFRTIDRVFHPKAEAENHIKETIYLKKLGQGDVAWSTYKTV